MFTPVYAVEQIRTGLLDGKLPILKLFFERVAPILQAAVMNSFSLMEAVRLQSPRIDTKSIKDAPDQLALLDTAGAATESICALLNANDPLIGEVPHVLLETGLLDLPDHLVTAL